jgi:circadian clock protein KaiB
MKSRPPTADETHLAMERGVARKAAASYDLRLYVTGGSEQSTRAIINLRRFCQEHLEGRHHLEIIDLRKRPDLAAKDGIIAAPTMVKLRPLPLRRFIGDMSNRARLLAGLGLTPAAQPSVPD